MTPGERWQHFGEWLRALRERRGLSLRDVERLTNPQSLGVPGPQVGASYLSQLERGLKGIPSPKILRSLANVYGETPAVLFQQAGIERIDPVRYYGAEEIERAFAMMLLDEKTYWLRDGAEQLTPDKKVFAIRLYQSLRGLKLLPDLPGSE